MPRKGPATRRELVPDPIYRSVLVTQVVNKVLSRGKRTLAERIVYDALEHGRGEDRRPTRSPILKRAVENTRPELEVQEPPGRWRHLPGAGRGASPPGHHPGHPLAGRATRRQRREKTMAERLANEILDAVQRHRRRGQAPRGHAQDGRVQQGLRPLPLVAAKAPCRRATATGPIRHDPKAKHHG